MTRTEYHQRFAALTAKAALAKIRGMEPSTPFADRVAALREQGECLQDTAVLLLAAMRGEVTPV